MVNLDLIPTLMEYCLELFLSARVHHDRISCVFKFQISDSVRDQKHGQGAPGQARSPLRHVRPQASSVVPRFLPLHFLHHVDDGHHGE